MADGSEIEVTLQLGDQLLPIGARVVREAYQPGTFAVTFVADDAALEDRIQDWLVSQLEAALLKRILVVDDCAEVRRAVGRQLAAMGCLATLARNPLEALDLLDSRPFDAALVDLRLGDSDGISLLSYLTEMHPVVRRILMSGAVTESHLKLAVQSGRAHTVLHKPLVPDTLVESLRIGAF
jgi:CheY-like chemotaxis protein